MIIRQRLEQYHHSCYNSDHMKFPRLKKQQQRRNLLVASAFIVITLLLAVGLFYFWQYKTEQSRGSSIAILNGNVGQLPVSGGKVIPERMPLEHGTADWLSIPDRKIEAPIIYVDEANEKVFQDALTRGVVHYPNTALPGELGNPYIFGHSSDYAWKAGKYKTVLKPLVDIPIGTTIRITNRDGELFIYTVKETKIVGPKDVSVLDQFNYERTMLTLQTSWPIGTALKRFVAIAELNELATYGPTTTTN